MHYRRKLAPFVAGAVLSGAAVVVEGREPEHIEQQQYEEPSRLTYEIANSTATFSVGAPLLDLVFPIMYTFDTPSIQQTRKAVK